MQRNPQKRLRKRASTQVHTDGSAAYLSLGELGYRQGADMRAPLQNTHLLALRDVAEAYGGLGMVAEQASTEKGGALPITLTQGQPVLDNLAGGAQVGRDADAGESGESHVCVRLS